MENFHIRGRSSLSFYNSKEIHNCRSSKSIFIKQIKKNINTTPRKYYSFKKLNYSYFNKNKPIDS